MKVEDKREQEFVTIGNATGEVFSYKGELWIVSDKRGESFVTCVCLNSGMVYDFDSTMFVTPINAKVVIE